MSLSDWLISIAALIWLITIAVFDIRERKVPHPVWTGLPMLVAAIYRLATGQNMLIVAAAAVVVVVSERRHLQQKVLEAFILAAGILVLVWLLFTTPLATAMGIIGVIVFWVSWERHYIGGADAMALITCLILWPGIEFVGAYLIAGLIWSLAVRIKQGGWLKGHESPGLAIIAAAAVLFMAYQAYRSLKI
jgi:dolichol kinase